ncbi:hypothetical protein [Yoonia sp.]|uniref:hypothetical protein n=1 Tax=Yoonia sp. TaxID=2212373 RepID=UPI0025E64E2C|nr:hypothetical protein [Yoonia sp.]
MTYPLMHVALAGAIALAAGCASNDNDDSGTNVPKSFATLSAEATAMADTIVNLDTGESLADERDDLPDDATAQYTGYVGGLLDGDGFIGELTLNVDFDPDDNGAITGSATGFQHETKGAYTGLLTLNGGTILPDAGLDPNDDVIAGELIGTLNNGGNDYATDIQLDGSFFGGVAADVPTEVGGYAGGNVGADNFVGGFIAN